MQAMFLVFFLLFRLSLEFLVPTDGDGQVGHYKKQMRDKHPLYTLYKSVLLTVKTARFWEELGRFQWIIL